MDYLVQQNRRNAGDPIPPAEEIRAADKRVVVIGGGDTGSDCVGAACRQGARSLTQIELLPEPPKDRPPDDPWPTWPTILRTSSSHEEGCDRLWSVLTKEFLGLGTHVRGLRCVQIAWSDPDASGLRSFHEVPDSEFRLEADLVILALGFVHAEAGPLVRDLGIDLDRHGNLRVDEEFRTSASGVYAAGDAVAGTSLVVRAIDQSRRAAQAVDRFLRSA
jgi:NADPH-dependent glutamate synthase beta subunit-like oxidoreductase